MSQGLSLQTRLTQSLVLAPQLQQSLALLQAPTLELKALIEQELQQNPVLEETEAAEQLFMYTDSSYCYFINTKAAGTSFYIGWKIWYKEKATAETRQFAVFHSPDRVVGSFVPPGSAMD